MVGVLAGVFLSRGLGGPGTGHGTSARTQLEGLRRSLTEQVEREAATYLALGSQAASTPAELAALDGTIAKLRRRLDAAVTHGQAPLAVRLRSAIAIERAQLGTLTAMLVTVESLRDTTAARVGALRARLADVERELTRLPVA